jgi:drug/metabolite transporter (DMT)-like permease
MSLTARSKGDGTHTQIGLPGCRSMVVDGVPCPTCGLTTSITAAAHGDFGASVSANVFGTVLFFALVLAGVIGALQAVSGRNMLGRIFRRRWWLFGGLLIMGVLAGWAVKLAIGYNTGQYPTH